MAAVIAFLVVMYGVVIGWMVPHFEEIEQLATENEMDAVSLILEDITDFSTAFLPFSVPCIIAVLGLGWVLCALLAKRREK